MTKSPSHNAIGRRVATETDNRCFEFANHFLTVEGATRGLPDSARLAACRDSR